MVGLQDRAARKQEKGARGLFCFPVFFFPHFSHTMTLSRARSVPCLHPLAGKYQVATSARTELGPAAVVFNVSRAVARQAAEATASA